MRNERSMKDEQLEYKTPGPWDDEPDADGFEACGLGHDVARYPLGPLRHVVFGAIIPVSAHKMSYPISMSMAGLLVPAKE